MTLIRQLKNAENFSSTDRAIASYILSHPQDVIRMSARELAKATFSSASAVIRLCQKLNFQSFSELKVKIAEESKGDQTLEMIDADYPMLKNIPADEIVKMVSDLECRGIRETAELLNVQMLAAVSKEIERAPGIAIYGLGFSSNAGKNLECMLRRLGYRVTRDEDWSRMTAWATFCDKADFSILVSYSGNTDVCKIAAILNRRGMRSVSVTSNTDNPLCKMTTYNLPVALTERQFGLDRIAPVSSVAECEFVLNVLYFMVYSRQYERNQAMLESFPKVQGFESVEAMWNQP